MAKLLMVLNDGDTFTNLSGCKMISVPDNWDTEDEPDLIVLCEFN